MNKSTVELVKTPNSELKVLISVVPDCDRQHDASYDSFTELQQRIGSDSELRNGECDGDDGSIA